MNNMQNVLKKFILPVGIVALSFYSGYMILYKPTDVKPTAQNWSKYENKFMNYEILIPGDLDWCVEGYNGDDGSDCVKDENRNGDLVIGQTSKEGRMIMHGSQSINITNFRNTLGISAVDFAKYSLSLNRKNHRDYYSNERDVIFAGEPAYEFLAQDGFEESGLFFPGDATLLTDPERLKRAGFGISLPGLYKVIYLDHDGYLFRILVPETPDFQKIISTFKFTNLVTGSNSNLVTYANSQYGFSIPLTSDWKGYTVIMRQWDGLTITTSENKITDHGPILVLRHPAWTNTSPREDMPIMIFTPTQWDLVINDKMSVGAAPFSPSLLGRNSNYVMALPARYNYDELPGYQEVDKLVHTLKAY